MHCVRIGNYHKWARKTHCFDPRLGIKTWGTTGIQKLIPINTEGDASSANFQPGICRLKVIAMEENGCAFSLQDPTVRERRPCISCCFSCMVHSVWGAGYVFCINGNARAWAACCPEGRHWPLHDFSTTSNNAWGPDAKRTNVDCATSTPQFIAPWFPDIDSQLMRECGSRMLSWCVSHI